MTQARSGDAFPRLPRHERLQDPRAGGGIDPAASCRSRTSAS